MLVFLIALTVSFSKPYDESDGHTGTQKHTHTLKSTVQHLGLPSGLLGRP